VDTSVALVQAYLHVNGYFTVAEYSVLEAYRVLQIALVRFGCCPSDHAEDLVQQERPTARADQRSGVAVR
jgi:hypothetical protein